MARAEAPARDSQVAQRILGVGLDVAVARPERRHAPARVPHQFRPALRMNATLRSHGQSDQQGTLSGTNFTNLVLAPANLLGGNSVSRFPRSVRLPSGTGATSDGAGTSYVPAIFVPRGVQ